MQIQSSATQVPFDSRALPFEGSQTLNSLEYGPQQATGPSPDTSSLPLDSLFVELGIEVYSFWLLDPQGEIKLTSSNVSIEESTFPRFKHLISATLMRQEPQSLVIVDSASKLVVASVIPGFPNEVLAAHYPKPSKKAAEIAFELTRNVSLAAARLGVCKLETVNRSLRDSQAHDRFATEPNSNDSDKAETSEKEVTWDIALEFFRSKILTSLKTIFTDRTNLAILGGVCFLLGFIPFPHSVRCKAVCEPAVRRVVGAPFDGKLEDVHVRAGDQVTQGQVLAIMDGSELRSERAALEAKLAQARQRRAAALTTQDPSKAELERLEVNELRSEIEVLEGRASRLELRSPIDGIVVIGDLERAKGAPLATGEDLFEIAPLEALVVEVAIPERDISYVENGLPISIQLDSARGRTHRSELKSVHPRNELRDNQSVFIGEADIENSKLSLRPGMNGSAKIHAGFKPLGWILFHRPFEALRKVVGW